MADDKDSFINFLDAQSRTGNTQETFTGRKQLRERPNLVISSAEVSKNDILSHEEIRFVESVSNENLHAAGNTDTSNHSAWSKYKGEAPPPSNRPQSASARAKYVQDRTLWSRFKRHIIEFKESEALRPVAQYLYHQPALFVTFIITFTYFIAYFGCSIIWCFAITTAVGSTCKVLLKRQVKQAVDEERQKSKKKKEANPEPESCEWLNKILSAVYGNHHLYISHLFVRFASPLLQKICTPPPIESVEFRQLDVTGTAPVLSDVTVSISDYSADSPTKNLNYDFNVYYDSEYRGIVVSKLKGYIAAGKFPVYISCLRFECRMRFSVTFVENRFPFISSLRWSLLERPSIKLKVKAGGLPVVMGEMRSVTEHFLELVSDEMFNQIGTPLFVEAKFSSLHDGELSDEVDRFVTSLIKLIPKMREHGAMASEAVAPEDSLDPDFPVLGVVSKAVNKIKRTPGNTPSTRRKPDVAMPTRSATEEAAAPPSGPTKQPRKPPRRLQRSSSDSSLNLRALAFPEQHMKPTEDNSPLAVSTPTHEPVVESPLLSPESPGTIEKRARSISLDSNSRITKEEHFIRPPGFPTHSDALRRTTNDVNPLSQAQMGILFEEGANSTDSFLPTALRDSSSNDSLIEEIAQAKYLSGADNVPKKSLRQATKKSFNRVRRKIGFSSNADIVPPAPRGQ